MKPGAPVIGLNWAFVLVGVADATLLPYIPLYLFEHGLGAAQIGVVLAAAAAASLGAGMGWAYLSDRRIRPERAIVAASGAAAGVALLLVFATGPVVLAAVTVGLLIARAPFQLLDAIALHQLREASRTRYARIRLRMSAGWAVSAVISGGIYQAGGLRLLPFLYAPLVVLFGFWVAYALGTTPRLSPEAAAARAVRPLAGLPVAMVGFLAGCFLLGASSAAAQNFIVLRINVLGGGALLIGAAAAFQALTEIPTMGSTHLLMRRLSRSALFAIGCGVYVVVFGAWGVVSSPAGLALLRLVTGVAFALTYVAAVLIADELSPAHLRATGQALVKSVMFGLAPIAGSLGGGVAYGAFGPRAMFFACAVVAGAAGAIAMVAIPAKGQPVVLERAEEAVEPARP